MGGWIFECGGAEERRDAEVLVGRGRLGGLELQGAWRVLRGPRMVGGVGVGIELGGVGGPVGVCRVLVCCFWFAAVVVSWVFTAGFNVDASPCP